MARQTKPPAPRRAKRLTSVDWRRARLIEADEGDMREAQAIMCAQLIRRLSLRPRGA